MNAPAARGRRWRWSQPTAGEATTATTPPASTGPVIVWVIPITHVSPTTSRPTPDRSQEAIPRSRSHRGAANTADILRSSSVSS